MSIKIKRIKPSVLKKADMLSFLRSLKNAINQYEIKLAVAQIDLLTNVVNKSWPEETPINLLVEDCCTNDNDVA